MNSSNVQTGRRQLSQPRCLLQKETPGWKTRRNVCLGCISAPETEPSHKLVDTICQMAVDQTLEWTPWEKLTSRSSEITHSQKDLKFSLDSQGSVKIAAKTQSPDANVTVEMRVRQALNRRARAFDVAQLCRYTVMEAWHERIFEVLQKEPAPSAMPVTMHQLREADKMLFRKLAEKTRGALAQQPDGSKPMEAHFDTCADHAEVQFCLIPMVRGATKKQQCALPFPKTQRKGEGKRKSAKGSQQTFHAVGPSIAAKLPPNDAPGQTDLQYLQPRFL